VVSSDHRLHRAAKRRKATPIDGDQWFRELLRARHERTSASSNETVKPEGPFSPAEVDSWLAQFGLARDSGKPADQ
jgi:uncharacterized protein